MLSGEQSRVIGLTISSKWGSREHRFVKLTMPSIHFPLLILERFSMQNHEEIVACGVLTVMLSMVVPGVSANPMAARFKQRSEQDRIATRKT